MFTGLVTAVGRISHLEDLPGLRRFRVESTYPASDITMGASIMHSGVCLTVVEHGEIPDGSWWWVEAVPETLEKTNLGSLSIGDSVNLEQSLKMGDELGGHFVSGHVDGVGRITAIEEEGDSHRVTVLPPPDMARFFVTKGSATIDGISLTVAQALDDGSFQVAIIPHTWDVTTLGAAQVGREVNLEVDMLARYVDRLIEARK